MKQSNAVSGAYIPELDGLRGIAILLVVIHHFWPRAGYWVAYEKLPHLGWIGVDLFFVISGFLIGGILLDSAHKPHYYKNFYARRSLRIFPLYYLFLVGVFVLIPHFQHGPYMQTEFIRQSGNPAWYFAYLGNLRESITGHEPAYFLAPLWSLSIEEQFYLLFPLLVASLKRSSLKKLMIVLIVVAPIFRFATFLAFRSNERIQYLATFSRMDVIAAGVLLAILVREKDMTQRRRTIGVLAASGLFLLAVAFVTNGLDRLLPFCRIAGYSLVAATFAWCLLWTVVARPAFLRTTALRNIGKLCYGIYLLQRPTEVAVTKLLPHLHIHLLPNGLTVFFVKMAATYGVAWLSWNLMEKHLLKLKKYFVPSRSERRPVPVFAP
ncbi:MAG: acyltransferase [Acidobacteriaceae bacterium]